MQNNNETSALQPHNPSHLKRGLNARHIRFLALGSAIGTGLFYGSPGALSPLGAHIHSACGSCGATGLSGGGVSRIYGHACAR